MNVDAAGVAHEANAALSKLSATANAPVFSYIDNFFGDTTVGGPMHSVEEGSASAAAVAVRILNGEKAGDIKTPPNRYALPKFDWRQMQRWGIRREQLASWQYCATPGASGMGALFVADCAHHRHYSG